MGLHGRLATAEEILSKQKDGSKEKLSDEAWKDTQARATVSTMSVSGVPRNRREFRLKYLDAGWEFSKTDKRHQTTDSKSSTSKR